jgi:hypothetical protein
MFSRLDPWHIPMGVKSPESSQMSRSPRAVAVGANELAQRASQIPRSSPKQRSPPMQSTETGDDARNMGESGNPSLDPSDNSTIRSSKRLQDVKKLPLTPEIQTTDKASAIRTEWEAAKKRNVANVSKCELRNTRGFASKAWVLLPFDDPNLNDEEYVNRDEYEPCS